MSAIQERGAPVEGPTLLFSDRRCRIHPGQLCVLVDRVGLWTVLIEDCVAFILWNSWDPLHTPKTQLFFAMCEHNMTEHILIIFPTLHEVRSELALARVSGRTTVCDHAKAGNTPRELV